MIFPIVAYGDAVLKKKASDIDASYPKLNELIANMFQTMYHASGVGLAAPQIGLSIRLFIVDCRPFEEDHPELKDFKKVFINAEIISEEGEQWKFSEGCLSIPGIREDVERCPSITIRYMDENFVQHEETFSGIPARVIQHEYDHIEGVLFTDRLHPFKRRIIQGKMNDISKGRVDVDYRMKFPKK